MTRSLEVVVVELASLAHGEAGVSSPPAVLGQADGGGASFGVASQDPLLVALVDTVSGESTSDHLRLPAGVQFGVHGADGGGLATWADSDHFVGVGFGPAVFGHTHANLGGGDEPLSLLRGDADDLALIHELRQGLAMLNHGISLADGHAMPAETVVEDGAILANDIQNEFGGGSDSVGHGSS